MRVLSVRRQVPYPLSPETLGRRGRGGGHRPSQRDAHSRGGCALGWVLASERAAQSLALAFAPLKEPWQLLLAINILLLILGCFMEAVSILIILAPVLMLITFFPLLVVWLPDLILGATP